MEGIKIVIFALVALVWLVIWIVRIFNKAFNQPTSGNPKPLNPNPASLEEMLRQHRPKTAEEIQQRSETRSVLSKETLERPAPQLDRDRKVLERSETRQARTLESQMPRRRSLEKLEPMGNSQERILGESTIQREDIVRRRREKNIYQASDKKPVSVYARMLQNPQSAREAIVLAEILKPKF